MVYLCHVHGQMETNIKESKLDEILAEDLADEMTEVWCGGQQLKDGRVVHGKYLVGTAWLGLAFEPGRLPPHYKIQEPFPVPRDVPVGPEFQ